jgi:hypothetical protein
MRRRVAQQELKPVYVQPIFTRRERAALREFRRAAYAGERHRPQPGDFDPLWLRLGLRASTVNARAGWVVNNPLFDQTLRQSPHTDPSLPGPGWLREVYGWQYFDLVTLPECRSEIERRHQERRHAELAVEARPAATVQPDLFQEPVA